MLVMIAAMTENRVIAKDGRMPWRLPADLARFQRVTTGHPVIMGRTTFETLPGPLPRRTNIILTSNESYTHEGIRVAHSPDQALAIAREIQPAHGEPVYIAGGGVVYETFLTQADRLDLTMVEARVDGDTFFPAWDRSDWTQTHSERHPADDRHSHAYRFELWERASPAGR